jgi:hypothetical protein
MTFLKIIWAKKEEMGIVFELYGVRSDWMSALLEDVLSNRAK